MSPPSMWLSALLVVIAAALAACDETGAGGECAQNSDCALGQACLEQRCSEAPCGPDNPCALGQVCSGGQCVAGSDDDGVVVADLGTLRIGEDGSEAVTVDVAPGTESLAVVVDGGGANLVLAETVRQPGGGVVFDWRNQIDTNRSDATDGVYTLLVPSTPQVVVEPGRWRMTFLTDGPSFDARLTAVLKTAPAQQDRLDLNLFFVGVDGLDATSAPGDADFLSLLTNVEQRLGDAGLRLGTITYHDITGSAAERLRVIDSVRDHDDELFELFALSGTQDNRALDLFFVADIATRDGFSLLGLAGGIPGPPLVHGTLRSGVAVNLDAWIASSGDAEARAEARQLVELVIAHETGHYLGLYHTTERNGQALDAQGIVGADPLSDTPLCPDSADTSGNRILSAQECADHGGDNLMFWSPLPTSRTLTPQQVDILRRNPLVR